MNYSINKVDENIDNLETNPDNFQLPNETLDSNDLSIRTKENSTNDESK